MVNGVRRSSEINEKVMLFHFSEEAINRKKISYGYKYYKYSF